jgi:hypothetical protein
MIPGVRRWKSQIVGFSSACGRPLLTHTRGEEEVRRHSPKTLKF